MNLAIDTKKFAKEIILKRRLEEQISLRKLSKIIDVHFDCLSHYERQEFCPSEENFLKICKWLGKNPKTFILNK